MGALIAFLLRNKWLALVLAFAVFGGVTWAAGVKHGNAKAEARQLALQDQAVNRAAGLIAKSEELRQMVISIQADRFDRVQVKYVEYVKSDHPRVRFDDRRVRIKAAAVEAANTGSGSEDGAVQGSAAER